MQANALVGERERVFLTIVSSLWERNRRKWDKSREERNRRYTQRRRKTWKRVREVQWGRRRVYYIGGMERGRDDKLASIGRNCRVRFRQVPSIGTRFSERSSPLSRLQYFKCGGGAARRGLRLDLFNSIQYACLLLHIAICKRRHSVMPLTRSKPGPIDRETRNNIIVIFGPRRTLADPCSKKLS